ncbi:phage tail protein [Geobacter sp. SVR]|uniref:phage tail-collar fiber domain-containing protein n=1 Tax=Geobacter sp. SVR TaxID=2495594 RepID=UPI00143F04D4|nr:phage tail protein [Geobacter sp. SVR]BCS54572.1 hypothetical protein GSVR_28800 [Geobacter sp. SVR]GCF86921.1 hypothetical protein GSbR_35210 [Geobacter sp. SVR]
MPAEFRWIMTGAGLAKRAIAEAGGAPVAPAQFAVGDGDGEYHEPEELVDGLINETWRGDINKIYRHDTETDLVVIEAIIPTDFGGWEIREAAIYDADDDLILVGKYPLTEKPAPGSGGEKQIVVRGGLRISNGGEVVVLIDSDLVMATQEYVDDHALLTNPHGSTPAATANRLILRDAAGRAKIAAPSAGDDIARKDTVTAHIHNLAVAAGDFLVGSGPGAFVRKTLAEVKAILGLGDAAFKNTGTLGTQVAAGNHTHSNGAGIGGPYAPADVLQTTYPVGSLYFNASINANPASLFGFGTWVAFGAGRMLLGAGGGYTAGDTGGEATHTLITGEMPSHNHTGPTFKYLLKPPYSGSLTGNDNNGSGSEQAVGFGDGGEMLTVGGGAAHNNMPPYVVVYIWRRTA